MRVRSRRASSRPEESRNLRGGVGARELCWLTVLSVPSMHKAHPYSGWALCFYQDRSRPAAVSDSRPVRESGERRLSRKDGGGSDPLRQTFVPRRDSSRIEVRRSYLNQAGGRLESFRRSRGSHWPSHRCTVLPSRRHQSSGEPTSPMQGVPASLDHVHRMAAFAGTVRHRSTPHPRHPSRRLSSFRRSTCLKEITQSVRNCSTICVISPGFASRF